MCRSGGVKSLNSEDCGRPDHTFGTKVRGVVGPCLRSNKSTVSETPIQTTIRTVTPYVLKFHPDGGPFSSGSQVFQGNQLRRTPTPTGI